MLLEDNMSLLPQNCHGTTMTSSVARIQAH